MAFVETCQLVAPVLGAFASGMASVAAVLNVKRWIIARLKARREAKEQAEADRKYLCRQMTEWYVSAYRQLVLSKFISEEHFHELSIQQACAYLDDLPGWVTDGWELCAVAKLTN